MPCKPVETLACEQETSASSYSGYAWGGIASLILWFFIIAVIVWFILWLTKPTAVQYKNAAGEPTGQVDAGKVLIGAIVISLIIVILIALFRAVVRY